jgi:hypothetical protein
VLRIKFSTYIASLVKFHLEESVMRDIKQHVDTNSADFKQGVEAGLNSAEDTKNWQAGNELGQELKKEVENKEPVPESIFKESSPPLFMSDRAEGKKGNPQDEKDETEE